MHKISGIKIPKLRKIPNPGSKNPETKKIPNPGDKNPETKKTPEFFFRDFFGIFKSLSLSPGFRDFKDFSENPGIGDSGSRKNPIPKQILLRRVFARATEDGCQLSLSCDADFMDFRFDAADLFGVENADSVGVNSACPIQTDDTSNYGQTWKYALGSCDSKVTRKTDTVGQFSKDWIVISKELRFDESVTVEISCKFLAELRATSDNVAIETGNTVETSVNGIHQKLYLS